MDNKKRKSLDDFDSALVVQPHKRQKDDPETLLRCRETLNACLNGARAKLGITAGNKAKMDCKSFSDTLPCAWCLPDSFCDRHRVKFLKLPMLDKFILHRLDVLDPFVKYVYIDAIYAGKNYYIRQSETAVSHADAVDEVYAYRCLNCFRRIGAGGYTTDTLPVIGVLFLCSACGSTRCLAAYHRSY